MSMSPSHRCISSFNNKALELLKGDGVPVTADLRHDLCGSHTSIEDAPEVPLHVTCAVVALAAIVEHRLQEMCKHHSTHLAPVILVGHCEDLPHHVVKLVVDKLHATGHE